MVVRSMASARGLVAASLLMGCHGSKSPGAEAGPAVQTFKVETVRIVKRPVPATIPLTGTLIAEVRTDLAANASGRVARTFVERGQRVDRGTVLVLLDVRSAEAGAAEAQAQEESAVTRHEAAMADCARQDALAAAGALSVQQHDNQTAACKEQRAALAASRARRAAAALALENGAIRAPFAGLVTERFVSVGDYVQASSKVVTLVVGDPLRLRLAVPEGRISEVEKGALVTFAPTSMPSRMFSGRVMYLSGEVRASTRDMVVEAMVPNPDGALVPGMFVNVSLCIGEHPKAVVPRSAILAAGQDAGLFIVHDGRLVLRTVLLGAAADDLVAVEEGAAPGELVVTNPTSSMYDGARAE